MAQSSRDIYDRLVTKEDVARLVSEKVSEDLYLEFKQKEGTDSGSPSEGDKRHFGDTLSQFANSDGGVLLFGIKTKRGKDGRDVAVARKPVKEAESFFSKLSSYLPHAIQPSADGVLGKVILQTRSAGYVIFYVPKSFKTPHRASLSREYFKRGEFGKCRLEHFDLEDMFGRRQKPLMKVSIDPLQEVTIKSLREGKDQDGYLAAIQYNFFLHNEGRYVAKNVMATLEFPGKDVVKAEFVPLHASTNVQNITDLRGGSATLQISPAGEIFYPEVLTRIGTLQIKLSESKFDATPTVEVRWNIFAEDMVRQTGNTDLNPKSRILWE